MTDKPVFVIVSGSLCCVFGSELFASLSPLRTIERDQHTVSQTWQREGVGGVCYNGLSSCSDDIIGWFYEKYWSITFLTLFTAGAPVPDSFIDGYSPTLQRNSSKDTRETSSHRSQVRGVVDIFDAVKNFLDEKLVQKVNAVFEFHLTGKEAGVWYLDLKSSTGKHLNLLHCV